MTSQLAEHDTTAPDAELRLPADPAFVSVLRTSTAALAARLDLSIEHIEDLRIAVDEACALVLPQADVGSKLTASFWLSPEQMRVAVTVTAQAPTPLDHDGFAWTVLSALASEASSSIEGDQLRLVLCLQAGPDR